MMRIAYADPPYVGQGKRYHCPEIDHRELIDRLVRDRDLVRVSRLLNHADVKVTTHYLHDLGAI